MSGFAGSSSVETSRVRRPDVERVAVLKYHGNVMEWNHQTHLARSRSPEREWM